MVNKDFIQSISEHFLQLYQALFDTGLVWEDEDSYFVLNDCIENMASKLSNAAEDEREGILHSSLPALMKAIHDYKVDLAKPDRLQEKQMNRLVILNRIIVLFCILTNEITDQTRFAEFMISSKLIHGALISGLNGRNHKLFLNELLNADSLIAAIDYIAHSQPVVEKYGKSVSDKDKIQLSAMTSAELVGAVKKLFNENEIEFLARVPEYKNGFLLRIL